MEEYEGKIKRLIGELETTSKNHITKVNELHEHYMGYKSESAELQARIALYKNEQDRAVNSESCIKKEITSLTYANYELQERIKYVERKYSELGQRCGASQQDLEAIDVMLATNPHDMDGPGSGPRGRD